MGNPFFCFHCDRIQFHRTDQNFFEIFNLPVSYKIDSEKLDTRLEELILNLHPDFYQQSSSKEQQAAVHYSAILNSAKATLLSAFKRAKYLLQLYQIDYKEEDLQPGQEFILDMFFYQEDLDELESQNKPNKKTKITILNIKKEIDSDLYLIFKKITKDRNNFIHVKRVLEFVGKLKFIENLVLRLDNPVPRN